MMRKRVQKKKIIQFYIGIANNKIVNKNNVRSYIILYQNSIYCGSNSSRIFKMSVLLVTPQLVWLSNGADGFGH